jgi:hypothetical protein
MARLWQWMQKHTQVAKLVKRVAPWAWDVVDATIQDGVDDEDDEDDKLERRLRALHALRAAGFHPRLEVWTEEGTIMHRIEAGGHLGFKFAPPDDIRNVMKNVVTSQGGIDNDKFLLLVKFREVEQHYYTLKVEVLHGDTAGDLKKRYGFRRHGKLMYEGTVFNDNENLHDRVVLGTSRCVVWLKPLAQL